MGPLILDASVVIAVLDARDAHHERAVRDLESPGPDVRLVIPASALGEVLVAPARHGRTHEALDALTSMGCTVAPLDQAVALRAAVLRAEHPGLRLPDAIVVATARHLRARLLTYDKQLARFA